MADIKPQLIKQRLLREKTSVKETLSQDNDLHIQVTPLFGSTYHSSNIRTLKAVYTHFAKAKRKGMVEDGRGGAFSADNLSGDDLREAMEDAKSSFQTMKEVQQQLNSAYKELIHLHSKS